MDPVGHALGAASAVSLISLAAIAVGRGGARLPARFVSFAAGILVGTAVVDLVPEAIAATGRPQAVLLAVLATAITLWLAIRTLHDHEHATSSRAAAAWLVLAGDAVHNFLDGVAIMAAFLAGPAVGVATTLAIAAHELPHELADYAVLRHAGFNHWRALGLNLCSGLAAILGVLACAALGRPGDAPVAWLLAVSAGLFLYVALGQLLPSLRHGSRWTHAAPFLGGTVVATLIVTLLPG